MVWGRLCLADGSIATMCAGRISMVFALAAAVHTVVDDAADQHLDIEHHPYLLCLASAHTGTTVAGSGVDYAAGIRFRGNRRCNYRCAPDHTTGRATILSGSDTVKITTPSNTSSI